MRGGRPATRRDRRAETEQGFLLLERPRHALYLTNCRLPLRRATRDRGATDARRDDGADPLQQQVGPSSLPPYDEALLRREMQLFSRLVASSANTANLDDQQQAQWRATTDLLVSSALAQPTVAVAPRLHAAQPDGLRAQPRHPRLPGCGARPDQLRRRLAAARRFISWDE
jgi:aminoglycoside/choline kinase family phosphotransferase